MPVLAVFDGQANWRDTHVCDGWISDHLARHGVRWGRGEAEGQRTLESAGLFYLPTAQGYLGLLVEGGEWVAMPADAPHFSMRARRLRPTGCLPRCRASRPLSKRCSR